MLHRTSNTSLSDAARSGSILFLRESRILKILNTRTRVRALVLEGKAQRYTHKPPAGEGGNRTFCPSASFRIHLKARGFPCHTAAAWACSAAGVSSGRCAFQVGRAEAGRKSSGAAETEEAQRRAAGETLHLEPGWRRCSGVASEKARQTGHGSGQGESDG